MSTLFISDLHLSAQHPPLTHLFLSFLQDSGKHAEALYILGDLFAAWIGDDEETPFTQQIITALAKLTKQGIAIYFMPGNRDFLIGQNFMQKTGCQLLNDPSFISLYEIPTLLTHGDSLCTLDKRYMYFRRLSRTPLLQKLFLQLPLSLRQKIAHYLRNKEHPYTPSNAAKFDIVMSELFNCLRRYPAQLIIQGHTHQPCIQLFQLPCATSQLSSANSQAAQFRKRFVLSDWSTTQGNVLSISATGESRLIYFT
jgi:UDP-2,3-diacylglucosamine hydrolase